MQDFIRWLGDRPRWLQVAALRLGEARELDETELDKLLALCLHEASDKPDFSPVSLRPLQFGTPEGHQVRLLSIENVIGINALAPRRPLELGGAQLTVVYGENASGKSGYVRILKRICGARDPGSVMPDVFTHAPRPQRCTVKYEIDGTAKAVDWSPRDGVIDDLGEVDIFDTRLGRIVVTQENEVTYEPPVLTFISDLVAVCQSIRTRIDLSRQRSQLPVLPPAFRYTEAGTWYESLKSDVSEGEVQNHTRWEPHDLLMLKGLGERLDAESPSTEAAVLRRRADNLEAVRRESSVWRENLSGLECQRIANERETAATKRRLATLAAREAFSGAPLEGVGSEVWRALWEYGRAYSEEWAYPEGSFPYLGDGSRCVLCMQELSQGAKERFTSFEEFVKGAAEADARASELVLESSLQSVGNPPDEATVNRNLDAAGIEEPADRKVLESFFQLIRRRHARIAGGLGVEGELPSLPDLTPWETRLQDQIARLRERAVQFDEDATAIDRSGAERTHTELLARKWVSEQAKAIRSEIDRLGDDQVLEKAKSLATTTALSTKKSELAEQLISEAFADGFKRELRELSADRIRVQLRRTRTEKGHTLHRVHLEGLDRTDIGEVLSEGEFRVVALAASLADATVAGAPRPFVFDDPISSLDQSFEEAVVQRLVKLADARQVIVFTHRLSMLGLVEDYAKDRVTTDVQCVRREPWGTGEPGETSLTEKRPDRALRRLKSERLARAAKVFREKGSQEYAPLAKAVCSDYRILLERTIESVLLADIIRRHRRSIQTLGKLHKVAEIRFEDCEFLDGLMTKYSRYEHSQSSEAPVSLPEPGELDRDLTSLIEWIEEFNAR